MQENTFKECSKMPSEGQFVAMWEHKGVPWSATFKYNEYGGLSIYSSKVDSWSGDWNEGLSLFSGLKNLRFFLLS